MAVSKTHPPEMVLEAISAGVQHFGENRVEESSNKIPAVRSLLDPMPAWALTPVWHMIGHVQSRKAKDVPPLFDVVHSVDSVKLANRLATAAHEQGRSSALDVLIEVNVSGEASKEGFSAVGWKEDRAVYEAVLANMREITALSSLRVRGLMTMAPIVDDMEQARPVFASLRALRDALQESLGVPLPDLSMGMTDDYPVAIEEGATIIRVGRAIFGERRVMT